MAIQDQNHSFERSYGRVLWIGAAILSVGLALGAVHLLASVPVFGVKAVGTTTEMPIEEHPAQPRD